MSVEEIFQGAMSLPDVDRANLADQLLESLPDRFDPEFLAELDRRMDDLGGS